MATTAEWIEGARPRTLPAAIAPVLAGTAIAAYSHQEVWWKAICALLVSLLLQVGVNYANDYSDGIRGTDKERVGPLRLVGSGVATPAAVKKAAFAAFGAAAAIGLVLALSTAWWLVLLGALSILAAWYYTGGSKPYGYMGLGEVMVFCFFGLVAVLGTTYVQVHQHHRPFSWTPAWAAAVGVGAIACAILVANNLRDIPTDREVGKATLAVRLGDTWTRRLYAGLILVAVLALVVVADKTSWSALVGLVALAPLGRATRNVLRGDSGRKLILVLQQTGAGELIYAAAVLIALLVARP
ncbi:MAG: 1,4-dihydroxy-2-naphthoate polyprenyltransferase [Marmoricola sp.]